MRDAAMIAFIVSFTALVLACTFAVLVDALKEK